ncbi:helix-turn-helix transcriptional regulator [Robertkochia solimangrovi]|uniref:helix-turn-helix transcriptional regulator n=1 Tax=Robertkochia solimangrovi TaxID=2213046 RepID=UPI00117C6DA8|nr:metalloregulator ArsR/SmtB family transcription factor [Robertkochia solimangrovi]TRZ42416.1 MarR family transcriptional regulator [Robertkochia solimangrovi]
MNKLIRDSQQAIHILKNNGERTLKELADELGITTEGARFQLLKLAGEGFVKSESRAIGRGRPQQFWSLTQRGHSLFPDSHTELSIRLITKIKEELGEEALTKLIASNGRDNLRNYRIVITEGDALESKIQKLATLRDQEGYMAHFEKNDDGSYLFIENHCPICAAATLCQGFCSTELNTFQSILGPDVHVKRIDHILSGARRCAYIIENKA